MVNIASHVIVIHLVGLIYSSHPTAAFYERPGVKPKELLEARGYLAEEHYLTTPDGYRIRMTRGTNPLINHGRSGLANRDPILFSHGILEDCAVFLINSLDLKRPHDFSTRNLSDPMEMLRISKEPSARSLPFLAMDFGHEVWLLNRRGFPGSQEKLGNKWSLKDKRRSLRAKRDSEGEDYDQYEDSYEDYGDYDDCNCHEHSGELLEESDGDEAASRSSLGPILSFPGAMTNYGRLPSTFMFSFDKDFWNFSFDEQVRWDFPLAIEYVRNYTKRAKVATTTHSAAGSILLAMLASQPDISKKLASNIVWAPGFRLGVNDTFTMLVGAKKFFENYGRSVPPAFTTTKIQAILGNVCNIPMAPETVCSFFAEFITGESAGKEPVRPQFLSTLLYPTASGEFAQNLQNVASGNIMHYYDHGPQKNRRLYKGQDKPPIYDLSRVKGPVSLTIVSSITDNICSMYDVRGIPPLLKVPVKFHLIDTKFSHMGYFFHNDNAQLAIIPALMDIQKGSSIR